MKDAKSEKSWVKMPNEEHKFINEFHFSASGQRMLVFYSDADRFAHPSKKASFTLVVYDLQRAERKEFGEEDFGQINFSIAIEAYYSEHPELLLFEAESEHKQLPSAKVTAMAHHGRSTIMGTHGGEIFALRSEEFLADLDSTIDKERKVFASLVACSPSPIQKMQVVGNLLFVSCANSNGIICYRLEQEAARLPCGQKQDQVDAFGGKVSREQVSNRLNSIFPKREDSYECQSNALAKDEGDESSLSLELTHIFGRTAFHQRNNIFVSLKGDIISYAGCKLVLIRRNRDKNAHRQEFIRIDNNPLSTNPEITAMEMSGDRHTLYIGTTQRHAQMIVWNISTRTHLYSMPFRNIVEVFLIKVSETQTHAVLLALDRDARRVMLFLNLPKRKVLACHTFRESAEIHGV